LTPFPVYLSETTVQQLRRRAEVTDTPVSVIVRNFVLQGLDREAS